MWNFMLLEIKPEDALIDPLIGPGGLTRTQARAEIQSLLDREPAIASIARAWRQGAKDDTVYAGPFVWTIYSYDDGADPRIGALAWAEDFAATMRRRGLNVQIARLP